VLPHPLDLPVNFPGQALQRLCRSHIKAGETESAREYAESRSDTASERKGVGRGK